MNADALFERLRAAADEPYIGEPVSQLSHALQCAELASAAEADPDLIVAALFHDIGHLCGDDEGAEPMPGLGVARHEAIGARVLRAAGFSENAAWLVEHHVAAKRYLVATRPEYAAKLSAASRATLVLQGGPMSEAEVAAFEREPRFRDALRLRAWDERAKDPSWSGPPLAAYRALVRT